MGFSYEDGRYLMSLHQQLERQLDRIIKLLERLQPPEPSVETLARNHEELLDEAFLMRSASER